MGAGVIDSDYRGNVGVVLFNHGENDLEVARGDRVAQLVLERIAILDVEEVDDLECTTRGAGGFGSTGVKQQGERENAAPGSPSKRLKAADGDAATVLGSKQQ